MTEPNSIWTVDFKGHFKTLDGHYCYPDRCRWVQSLPAGLPSAQCTPGETGSAGFPQTSEAMCLPQILRTDNGSPFAASNALGHVADYSVNDVSRDVPNCSLKYQYKF